MRRLPPILRSRIGKSFRTSFTSYTVLLSPAATSPHDLHPLRVQGHIHVAIFDLHLVLGNGLHGRKAQGLAASHIELRSMEGAFDLVAFELALAQVSELVGADVLEGVELSLHVAQRYGPVLYLVLPHLAGGDLIHPRYLVELGHVLSHPLFEAQPDLTLYRPIQLLLEALERYPARHLAEEAEYHKLLGFLARYPPAHEVEELHIVDLARGRAVGALDVVGHYLQVRQTHGHGFVGAEDEVAVGLVGIGLLRPGLDAYETAEHGERFVAQSALVQEVRVGVRRDVVLQRVVIQNLI